MFVEQIYTNCLAEAAYYIESDGEAAIIDPLRETEPYIAKAKKRNAKIKYVFETHFHADFVSGHLDLARKTGATIVFGPKAKANYKIYEGNDGEIFSIGKIKIKLLHTPGHTPESTTYLLIDENGKNHAIFTGDTLFIGDVGRPDLAIGNGLTENDLAGMLYESLHKKILPLEDEIIVYPAHGAGSSCGKNMSKETCDTLGHQKKFNYALQKMSKEEFIAKVTDGIAPPPQYFFKDAMINKNGYDNLDSVMQKSLKPLSLAEFEKERQKGILVLDTRHQQIFCKGFIPNSLNFGLNGMFAIWVGTLIENINQPILLVAENGKEEESVMRLARVGYDNVIGFLNGGFETWKNAGKKTYSIISISAEEFARHHSNNTNNNSPAKAQITQRKNLADFASSWENPSSYKILDVRKPDEYDSSHLENAENFPLDYIWKNLGKLNKNENYYLHCRSGYRSMIAASILKKNGFQNLIEVAGGFEAIKNTGLPLVSAPFAV